MPMFVLERILRGLSEDSEQKIIKLMSRYEELMNKIKEFRVNKTLCDYHEVNK